jgi:hypothetical protein
MQRRAFLTALVAAFPARVFALYDPKPSQFLDMAAGAWVGALTYRDWANPDKLVTLPSTLSIALSAPEELALFYTFDDGPGKVVYSYERMSFDFKANTLSWVSGISKPSTSQYVVTSAGLDGEGAKLLFERAVEGRTDKYTFIVGRQALSLGKVEFSPSGAQTFRNKYEFRRDEA